MSNTVQLVVRDHLCISCGICAAVCPTKCISYKKIDGLYVPCIQTSDCIKCGNCLRHCPGKGCDYVKLYQDVGIPIPKDLWVGHSKQTVTAVSRDKDALKKATSGGVVTTLVSKLLNNGMYDCAFLVESNAYNDAVQTVMKCAGDNISVTAKSRYIPVMQSGAVEYMLNNPEKRIIFVGVPCFIQALTALIERRKLNRDHYLLIGLFCDKTMNYNVAEYFARSFVGDDKELKDLYFRTKEKDGWPGNVCMECTDGSKVFLPASERMLIKDVFVPERCLYCLDKLNQFADISVGDNYTKQNDSAEGSSNVIVRTDRALGLLTEEDFILFPLQLDTVLQSQHISQRKMNLGFQQLKESAILVRNENFAEAYPDEKAYMERLKTLQMGRNAEWLQIEKYVERKKKRKKWIALIKKPKAVLRKIKTIVAGMCCRKGKNDLPQ